MAFACRAYSPHAEYTGELERSDCVHRLLDLGAENATSICTNAILPGLRAVVVVEPRLGQMNE
ncbi:MAG: hypothetical protein ACK5S6_04375, partial [bacterium]